MSVRVEDSYSILWFLGESFLLYTKEKLKSKFFSLMSFMYI